MIQICVELTLYIHIYITKKGALFTEKYYQIFLIEIFIFKFKKNLLQNKLNFGLETIFILTTIFTYKSNKLSVHRINSEKDFIYFYFKKLILPRVSYID